MKNQLLEDMGDSHPVLPPGGRKSAAPPVRPAPGPDVRPKVWRGRQPAPAYPPPPPPSPAPPEAPPARAGPAEPRLDFSSFASQQPDMAVHLPSEPAPWMERWGRRVFGWIAALALVAGLAGAGWWLYGDSQVESTLALVADQTPPAAAAAPAAPPATPAAAAVAPPVVAPPVPDAEPEPVSAVSRPRLAPDPAPVLREVKKERPAPAVRKSVPKKPTKPGKPTKPAMRTVASREPLRSTRPVRPEPPARAQAAVAPPAPAAPPEDALAETLRLCRAAGYHASLCIKRGCAATKFGLACRG